MIEVRVSDMRRDDLWLLEGAWVRVTSVDVGHPDDRVGIGYVVDGMDHEYSNEYRGFEIAAVKRAPTTEAHRG